MTFGEAIEVVKKGGYAARTGWNGSRMYIYLVSANPPYEAHIAMYTAQGKHQPGWLASQADMLADDWVHWTVI